MWDWFKPEEIKPFLTSNGETSSDGQKQLGVYERQTRYNGEQAPQQPWESYDAYVARINS